MKLIWTDQAQADLDACIDYIAEDDPAAAYDLYEQIVRAVSVPLPDNPLMGREGRVAGTRELVVHQSYIVVYHVTDVIAVLAVMHTARLWPQGF